MLRSGRVFVHREAAPVTPQRLAAVRARFQIHNVKQRFFSFMLRGGGASSNHGDGCAYWIARLRGR